MIDETSIGGEQLGLRGGRQLAGCKALLVAVATASTLSRFIVRNIE